eukprot:14699462-Ditylum_brightwellii.AAC.1
MHRVMLGGAVLLLVLYGEETRNNPFFVTGHILRVLAFFAPPNFCTVKNTTIKQTASPSPYANTNIQNNKNATHHCWESLVGESAVGRFTTSWGQSCCSERCVSREE